MSSYKDFNRCLICRSAQNLKNYRGQFEVTMLLNTLYIAVLHPIEKRDALHIKAKPISKWLHENGVVKTHGNEFYPDDIVRYLRNGLAHLNIEVENNVQNSEKIIGSIKINAKNQPSKSLCKVRCSDPKCLPKQYLEEGGSICTFAFSINQLKEFTDFVIKFALEVLPNEICKDCPYKSEDNDVNTNLR